MEGRRHTRLRKLAARACTEAVLTLLLFGSFAYSAAVSPYFLEARTLFDMTSHFMEVGLMALAMTLVIVMGEIDLSVASLCALTGVVCGLLHERGVPMLLAAFAALVFGAALGALNGWLAAFFKLPSLVVTLGTMALYRGAGQILLGDRSAYGFPEWFVSVDLRYLPGTWIPIPLACFTACAALFFFLLHRTTAGRIVYCIGNNAEACRFSGIAVERMKVAIFALSGLMAAAAGLMMTSRFASARWDMASGLELEVITVVILGGTSIFGGRGTIPGTVLALFVIGTFRYGMGLANVPVQNQSVAIGLLLIGSILVPEMLRRWSLRPRTPGGSVEEVGAAASAQSATSPDATETAQPE